MSRKFIYASILLAINTLCAFAQIDDKFMEKAAKEVWAMDAPAFDPNTPIPDSISQGHSAVFIATGVCLDGKLKEGNSASKAINLGNLNTSITQLKDIRRYMVKLLDESAIEEFSSVDITPGKSTKLNNYNLGQKKNAFGARVHKATGEVVNVDVSKALSVTSGKKDNKEIGRRLAIPGLEVGDVLEYFDYTFDEVDEFSFSPRSIKPCASIPVLNFEFVGTFDPSLTVEYRTLNEAPPFQCGYGDGGRLVASISLKNLPVISTRHWFSSNRQVPFYRIAVLNNQSSMVWHPTLARKPGLYPNLPSGTYFLEAREVLYKINPNDDLVKHITSYMKDYMKKHPDDKRKDLIDRAWEVCLYHSLTDPKITGDELIVALSFREALRRLKLDSDRTGIVMVNGRDDIPTDCLLDYTDLDYMVVVDDNIYQSRRKVDCAPSEIPGMYQGETGAVIYSDFRDPTKPVNPEVINMPTTAFSRNVYISDVQLSVNTAEAALPIDFTRKVTANGTYKPIIDAPISVEYWAQDAEEYLEIPKNRALNKYTDEVAKRYEELFKQWLMSDTENTMGVEPKEINSFTLTSTGSLPNSKKLIYDLSGTVDGIVTDADGELIVEIGKFFGKNLKLTGKDRNREVDVLRRSPSQCHYIVDFTIPEGYRIDEESLADLNSDVKNETGCFIANATLSDDGRHVQIQATERYTSYVVPLDYWDSYLQIVDAAAAYNDATLILIAE